MSWLDKEVQIAVLTLADMQIQAYETFLRQYGTQALALKHTKIYMDAIALVMKPNIGGPK